MRYVLGFLCVCTLGVMPLGGCDIGSGDVCFPGPCPDPLCVGVVCPPDENECTIEYCSGGICRSGPVLNMPATACDFDGLSGICIDGVCGENLCEDVVCDDGNLCTEGTCDYVDGTCEFTPVFCDDGDGCTVGTCNPVDGCDFTTPAEDGTICMALEPAGVEALGMCEAGACLGPCDSESEEVLQCPIEGLEADFFCCPGSEYCTVGDCHFEAQP
jgi:hypothetical protein